MGVIVKVLTSPVTVSNCVTGVGDHVEVEEADEDVGVVVGMTAIIDDVVVGMIGEGEGEVCNDGVTGLSVGVVVDGV